MQEALEAKQLFPISEFIGGKWEKEINVRDFIQKNYTPYSGDSSFLAEPTEATKTLWQNCLELFQKERDNGGVLDMDTSIVSTVTSHEAGYINKELEQIVGLQTDKPLKRSLQPFGGIRMAEGACNSYGYEVDKEISKIYNHELIHKIFFIAIKKRSLPKKLN